MNFLVYHNLLNFRIQTVRMLNWFYTNFRRNKTTINRKIPNFYATLDKNNEGCQELSYNATHHKKVHYSALQWYYSSSTIALFSFIVTYPTARSPHFQLQTSITLVSCIRFQSFFSPLKLPLRRIYYKNF